MKSAVAMTIAVKRDTAQPAAVAVISFTAAVPFSGIEVIHSNR